MAVLRGSSSHRSDDPMLLNRDAPANGAEAKESPTAEHASHRKDKPTHTFNRSLPESHSV
jgi:hypothetical protein